MSKKLELLAPAGGPDELAAALKAGADAVYFGLKKLNARTGAKNFPPEALQDVVKSIHDAHAKAYLTLNIDLAQRELGLAARTLALAEQAQVDAVLIRDPAILSFIPLFPKLAFHFSTQAAVTTSAGVEAAKAFGITRVVLARELSEEEMKATIGHGVEIEVFVQGALCFSCSGRCLLSSWVGGRSGNRGACASPCRVRWTNQKGITSTPLSMHDMCLAGDLGKLAEIGVDSLKIEGRLKSAPWVSKTVSLYREALNGSLSHDELSQSTAKLGAYAGRKMSNAYFHGIRTDVTGESARPAGEQTDDFRSDCQTDAAAATGNSVRVSCDEANGTIWNIRYNNHETTLRTPPQRVANPKRAIDVAEVAIELAKLLEQDGQLADIEYKPESVQDRLLPRNAGNRVVEETTAFIRRSQKETDGVVRDIELPKAVREILEVPLNKCVENKLKLGDRATLLRVTPSQAEECFANRNSMLGSCKLIVDSQVSADT
ncbi:MAG: U32 family peptidase, partial [Victivallales bacterium]|nr:U32 family peptidase [Victivallales bacterium]